MRQITKVKPGYGKFGNLGKRYDEARQGFPQETIDRFWRLVGHEQPRVLDLGCGTGISTRQLVRPGAKLFGADNDPEMIRIAERKVDSEITYCVAPANCLPFSSETFDAVTAFSAFHWFCDKDSVQEIQRVLKPGGIFFVVNKDDFGDFKKEYRMILKPFVSNEIPDAKKQYDPEKILQESGFQKVSKEKKEISEYFTLNHAIAYFQSVSLWNLVSENKRGEARKALAEHCKKRLNNGFMERPLDITGVVGIK